MELKQLAPWNWFKRENDEAGSLLPVNRRAAGYPEPLARFHDEFDQLFETMLQGFPFAPTMLPSLSRSGAGPMWLKPSVDIESTDKAYTITAELPGVDEKEIEVNLSGDTLTIRAKKEQQKEEKNKNYYCVERSYGAFQRQLSLPEDADPEGVKAAYKNGVLTLTVPRKAAKADSTRQIEIHAA